MKTLLTSLFSLLSFCLHAQMPTNIPVDREPVRFFESTESVVFYIVIPLLIIVLYWLWRKRTKQDESSKNKN